MKRKIAAILAADIAGYSRLMAEDEEETLRRLGSYRAVLADFVARYGGRIFNTAGDATLAEFQSAVDAIRCAVDVQESLRTRNLAYAPGGQMSYRIGITIGDVVERDGDLLGDAVNIASRLESRAPAGGICISRFVYEAVTNKMSLKFDDMGLLQLKNIPDRVHAYTVAVDQTGRGRAPRSTEWRVFGIAAVLVLAVLGIGVYVFTRPILPVGTSSGLGPASPQPVAAEQDKTALSQAKTVDSSEPPSHTQEPKAALEEPDRKTAPVARDETRAAASTAAGPTSAPAPEQGSTTVAEQNGGVDKTGDTCRRYLPSAGKTVEVPCEPAQDRAQEPQNTRDAPSAQSQPSPLPANQDSESSTEPVARNEPRPDAQSKLSAEQLASQYGPLQKAGKWYLREGLAVIGIGYKEIGGQKDDYRGTSLDECKRACATDQARCQAFHWGRGQESWPAICQLYDSQALDTVTGPLGTVGFKR